MTVIELLNKLLHLPPEAKVLLANGPYTTPVVCTEVLTYDKDYNDIWLVGYKT